MNTLYFIRHAESEANKARILASQLPYPLTETGKADADLIASQLHEQILLDKIISSPLKRAVQTAESFSNIYNLKIEIDDRITEQHLGRFTGMTYDEVKTTPEYELDSLSRWNWVPAGKGESYKMVAERVISFLNDVADKYNDKKILIVTHAVTLRMITAALKNMLPYYPEQFPNNGEIIRVDFDSLGKKYDFESILLGNSKNFIHNP
ncbi:MAG: histidine phosphatase family protein [Spirochaetales bacterium]|uniref:Histidine phosphatase family protein n=1 Tax=Candidatus Thalassospirochaeta sargassi TaxID=3119039 RepID=A0AAJ1I9K1_9SPIO|nr:histidine phosphatase family protein [Spirochaetales bacterium]